LALTGQALLYTRGGALRAPWRVIGFLVATGACGLLAAVVVAPFQASLAAAGVPGLADWIVILVGVAGGHAVTLLLIEPRPWGDVWLGRAAARPQWLVEGFLLGVLAIGLPSVALMVSGWLAVESHTPGSWAGAAIRVSLLLLVAALAEELIFRGYLLAVLREKLGWGPALAVTSVAFGYVHISNPGASTRALVLVTLAGLFLGATVAVTRSLYAAWMALFAWNWTMAVLLHIPVSGLETEMPDYRTIDAGPDWVTGGAWGPEGGVGAGLGMMAGLAYLVARRRREAA
jgi:membrane protease YdiL (CAAX protease family)